MFYENSGDWLNLQVGVEYMHPQIRKEVWAGITYFRVESPQGEETKCKEEMQGGGLRDRSA